VTPGFLEQVRQCRRPLIAVVVMLVVLQALVSGLASARVVAMSASPFDVGVICHGAGDGAGNGAAPPADDPSGSSAARDLCCTFCAAAAPALLTVTPPVVGHVGRAGTDRLTPLARHLVLIAHRAVRAGLSQAPPTFA
jgi:Protein of unknown function (DUF2946)